VRKEAGEQLLKYVSPWMQYYLKYDPIADLRKVQCPVFAIGGDIDVQMDATTNLNTNKKYVKSRVTVKKYIDLNHMFQYSKTGFGLPDEYEKLEETIFRLSIRNN